MKVAVRVRPFNHRELSRKSHCIIEMSGKSTCKFPYSLPFQIAIKIHDLTSKLSHSSGRARADPMCVAKLVSGCETELHFLSMCGLYVHQSICPWEGQ